MKTLFFCSTIAAIFFSSVNLYSVEEPDAEELISEEATLERMAILKLMMHKNLMLTFVSHPKTMEYFSAETQRKRDYWISLKTEVEDLKRQFPLDPSMQMFTENFLFSISIMENPFPHEELVMPFLAWGLANLYGIQDEEVVKKIQDFQVKLFKNYLSREGIGEGKDLTEEIELFSRDCSLPIFSQIIGPLLKGLLKNDADIDDIVHLSCSDHGERLSAEQERELEEVYNPLLRLLLKPQVPELSLDFALEDAFWNELSKKLSPPDPEGASDEVFDRLEEKFRSQNFFSLERLTELFFEVMIEAYPEHKAFFLGVQNDGK
jgi:hypothetical protein